MAVPATRFEMPECPERRRPVPRDRACICPPALSMLTSELRIGAPRISNARQRFDESNNSER